MPFEKIIIVGAGPIGGFSAVLLSRLRLPILLYEKRTEYTRAVNLKIAPGFFKTVQSIYDPTGSDDFFDQLDSELNNHGNAILICELEHRFAEKAKMLGIQHCTEEVKDLKTLGNEKTLILDCSGYKSQLRSQALGSDEKNITRYPLQSVLYITLKAASSEEDSVLFNRLSQLSVIAHSDAIELYQVISGKEKDERGYTNITIAAITTPEFAQLFDRFYPDTNRCPLPVKDKVSIEPSIRKVVDSLLSNIKGCGTSSAHNIQVKRIDIECGYAKNRNTNNFVLLGDAAVFLAFFRSLNVGLQHVVDFHTQLSKYHLPPDKKTPDYIIFARFVWDRMCTRKGGLIPIKIYPTQINNYYLVLTKGLRYGCFAYDLDTHEITRLTHWHGLSKQEMDHFVERRLENIKNWRYSLTFFEKKRMQDTKNEIRKNRQKSWFNHFLGRCIKFFAWILPNFYQNASSQDINPQEIIEPVFRKLLSFMELEQVVRWEARIHEVLSHTSELKQQLILKTLASYADSGEQGFHQALHQKEEGSTVSVLDRLSAHRHPYLAGVYTFFKKKTRTQGFIEVFSIIAQPS